jgi:hypothetical protein
MWGHLFVIQDRYQGQGLHGCLTDSRGLQGPECREQPGYGAAGQPRAAPGRTAFSSFLCYLLAVPFEGSSDPRPTSGQHLTLLPHRLKMAPPPQLEEDGWLNAKVADHFVKYAKLCFSAFGDRRVLACAYFSCTDVVRQSAGCGVATVAGGRQGLEADGLCRQCTSGAKPNGVCCMPTPLPLPQE